jgi:hypothetical protein
MDSNLDKRAEALKHGAGDLLDPQLMRSTAHEPRRWGLLMEVDSYSLGKDRGC